MNVSWWQQGPEFKKWPENLRLLLKKNMSLNHLSHLKPNSSCSRCLICLSEHVLAMENDGADMMVWQSRKTHTKCRAALSPKDCGIAAVGQNTTCDILCPGARLHLNALHTNPWRRLQIMCLNVLTVRPSWKAKTRGKTSQRAKMCISKTNTPV